MQTEEKLNRGAPIGNQNAKKSESEKKTGKGRIVVDLGEWKAAIVADLKKGETLKNWLLDAIQRKLS